MKIHLKDKHKLLYNKPTRKKNKSEHREKSKGSEQNWKKQAKKPKRNILVNSIIKLSFFAFVIYALISIISVQVDISDKKDQMAILKVQEQELSAKNAECERILDAKDEKEYMQRLAMDKLGYAYPEWS